jgi:tetratricopeptide (TPR) repeat protein
MSRSGALRPGRLHGAEELVRLSDQEVPGRADDNNASAHFDFGNLLYRTGRVNEAIRQYMMALLIDPKYVTARYMLGNCL